MNMKSCGCRLEWEVPLRTTAGIEVFRPNRDAGRGRVGVRSVEP